MVATSQSLDAIDLKSIGPPARSPALCPSPISPFLVKGDGSHTLYVIAARRH